MLIVDAAEEDAEAEIDLGGDRVNLNTPTTEREKKRTSACTISPTFERNRSTTFSWIIGSCVKKRSFGEVRRV